MKDLRIFDEDIFVTQIYEPVLAALAVDKKEIRRRTSRRETLTAGTGP